MNFRYPQTPSPSQQTGDLSLEESREFLSEIGRKRRKGLRKQSSTSSLAWYPKSSTCRSPTGDVDVRPSLSPTAWRKFGPMVRDDQSTSDRMESLRTEAIQGWGDQLNPISQNDLEDASSYDADAWDTHQDHQEPESDVDVEAPSAEEISSLMSQLGQAADQAPQLKPASGTESAPDARSVPAATWTGSRK